MAYLPTSWMAFNNANFESISDKLTAPMNSRRFRVALSFPGEYREFVSKVADCLAEKFGKQKVLYDKYYEAEFARPDLDVYLPNLYRAESELIAIFLCEGYKKKRWCKLEWRSIRQLIATADEDRIMLLSFDDIGAIPEIGIYDGDGYVSIGKRSSEEIAQLILERAGFQPPEKPPTSACNADISRIVKYAPENLIGREYELTILNEAWNKVVHDEKPRACILTFVALGGEGKTSLVAKWVVDEMLARDWPGCDAAFAWSFYSQGTREQLSASSDLFLKEALNFFGDEADKAFAASPAGAFEKGQRLARAVARGRNLLILDGLEPLQYAATSPTPGELKDGGLAALLKGLATASQGLCIVTTRYSVADLKAFKSKTLLEIELKRLSREAGVNLLQSLDVRGSLLGNIRSNDGNELLNEYEKLVEDVNGHALTLNLIGTYLRDAHGGDIRRRDLVRLEEADAEEQGGHAFRVMEAYERSFEEEGDRGRRALAILRLLGLFDRPMTDDCFRALLQEPAIPGLTESLMSVNEGQLNMALSRLQSAKLITVNRDAGGLVSIDAHPLLREYFARQLREKYADAWREGHRRIYEHLVQTTDEGEQPTLEGLQPLYQAVHHGCQAGLQQEAVENVFYVRIRHRTDDYATRKLGAFGLELGAAACFFEIPWSRVSSGLTEIWQPWVLMVAGYCLRALGRMTEALEPMRAGLKMRIKQGVWKSAAIIDGNLSELELTLGDVAGAVEDAEQSVIYADRSGDAFQQESKRTTHADALHQAGRRTEALGLFREAEQMEQERQPSYKLLYSLRGFQYCDLLLATSERAAWQEMQDSEVRSSRSELVGACHDVSQRAAQTLKIADEYFGRGLGLLDIALDHLTLGRAALYEAIISKSEIRNPKSEIEQAVAGLRRAGTTHHLPRALLSRAWLRSLEGNPTGPESAQEDLDEAWDIAERGPMKLFMADIHLYRARLFGSPKSKVQCPKYPWKSAQDDLTAARELIEQCGYWRRKEELEDAEAAAKNW